MIVTSCTAFQGRRYAIQQKLSYDRVFCWSSVCLWHNHKASWMAPSLIFLIAERNCLRNSYPETLLVELCVSLKSSKAIFFLRPLTPNIMKFSRHSSKIALPFLNLFPLTPNSLFIACLAKMEWSPLNIFPLPIDETLSFVSRGC